MPVVPERRQLTIPRPLPNHLRRAARVLMLPYCRTSCRCGWDCEADGYDDDSNPLPAFKDKYDNFSAQLRAGRTAAWKGKHVGPRG